MSTSAAGEETLLAQARQGDADAFTRLTEPYRRELLVYGYRLLGSFQDSEDLAQETLLRAWTKLATFEGRASFRAWLYKIATNTGLNMLAQAARRTVPLGAASPAEVDPTFPAFTGETRWLEPLPDVFIADVSSTPDAIYSLRESVSLAFMVALHRLPPLQRATLILRDVLDWHAAEVAEFLEQSIPSINSALQRARATLAQHYHPIGLEAIEAPVLSPSLQALLDSYLRAWEANDVGALVSLLKEDATFSMPPQPQGYAGREAITHFFASEVFASGGVETWRLVPTRANGQPAFVLYHGDSTSAYGYFGLLVLSVEGDAIASAVAFIDPTLGMHYGLPLAVPPSAESAER